ncbi:MAG: cobalt-zinc-cadmium efflux system protein [Microbacteriaceae bacterium]|nr:cobalt-zinc-cadmium efflux system protein [Microbacteriaceae bacterium]
MGHDHGASAANRGRLTVALTISSVILLAEIVGAVLTGSLALIVDAGHLLTDVGGLAMALLAASLAARAATSKRTWGFARAEVLAATAQAAVLLAVGLFVLVEGIRRLVTPPDVPSAGLLLFGIIGLVGNLVSIAVLSGARTAGFNLRAAFLEVVNDALGSLAVIVAAVVIALTGWQRADAVAGILIGVLILPRAFVLLRDTVDVLLESAPAGLDLDAVRIHLLQQDHVLGVHDLHATQIASGLPVLTAHVTIEEECFTDGHTRQILDALQACVAEHFPVAVEHSTFQLEPAAHQGHEHTVHH